MHSIQQTSYDTTHFIVLYALCFYVWFEEVIAKTYHEKQNAGCKIQIWPESVMGDVLRISRLDFK